MERIPKQEPAQKVDHGEENSSATPTGTRTRDLSITSTALPTTEPSPIPYREAAAEGQRFVSGTRVT